MPYICIDESTGQCTEQYHCLNNSCRFNKTTVETYAEYHHEPEEYIPQLKKKWPKLVKCMDDFCQYAFNCMDAYKEDPQKLRVFTIKNREIKKRLGYMEQGRQQLDNQELSAFRQNDHPADAENEEQNPG
jgi:hypothetical protein